MIQTLRPNSASKQIANSLVKTLTFIAPLVAMALREIPVKNVHKQHKHTNRRLFQTPAIPTILQKNIANQQHKKKKPLLNFSTNFRKM
jgi:inner membrane protein involved in colicin E2 resistance